MDDDESIFYEHIYKEIIDYLEQLINYYNDCQDVDVFYNCNNLDYYIYIIVQKNWVDFVDGNLSFNFNVDSWFILLRIGSTKIW